MPRIMTMNGDHRSVAAAPLDLRTTNRERGGAGSRTPDCGLQRTCQQGRSPAPPACTGTSSLETRCHTTGRSSEPGAARKRPADNPSKLPFRKRPIQVEPETQTRSPAPAESGERVSTVEDVDLVFRESLTGHLNENRVVAAASEEPGQSAEGYPMRLLHPIRYSPYPMFYVPTVLEASHPLAYQTENLLAGIALATHQDEDGDTALHIAVVQGELAIVCTLIHLLLWARRGLDIYNNLRQTPLHLAVITQQAEIVDVLLKAGADPTALDRNGQTALHLCCEYNQRDCLSVVLSRASSPVCLEIRNYEGLSPLHLAVLRGHKDLARMLLDAGSDINAMDIKSGQSPLMHAVEHNNADMVHFLIESGCDVNGQSYSGNTALHGACGRGQVDTVRLLLKSGADSSLKNYHNDTAVMVARNKKLFYDCESLLRENSESSESPNEIADVLRGRGSKLMRDQHSVSVSPHGSHLSENGSPSPSQSRGCSPSSRPHTPHRRTSHSPKTPSLPLFPLC